MPTAGEMRALRETLDQEKARSRAYFEEGKGLKEALTHYEDEIAAYKKSLTASEDEVERLRGEVQDLRIDALTKPNHDEVSLVALKVNLQALKQALVRQQVYSDRQAEGYARILASIPGGNETLSAYYEAYVSESAAIEDLMLQIDQVLANE